VTKGTQTVGHASRGSAISNLEGASCLYEGYVFFKEIRGKYKIYIFLGTLVGRNIKLTLFYNSISLKCILTYKSTLFIS
jgi:hypothetical protein